MQHGDLVKRLSNGQQGIFLGFVNPQNTKCAVTWGKKKVACSAVNKIDNSASSIDGEFVTTSVSPNVVAPKYGNDSKDKDTITLLTYGSEQTATATANVSPKQIETTTNHSSFPESSKVAEHISKPPISAIRVGDMIYDRGEDLLPACPRWLVVTQMLHRRADCQCKCEHFPDSQPGHKRYDPDPLRITLAPALNGPTGITNKPDQTKKRECWRLDHVQTGKKVTDMMTQGFQVMCRDNHHICLVTCRKYKKMLRARYCRMRFPRRPMEHTTLSQLQLAELNQRTFCTIASAIKTQTGPYTVRPLKGIKPNNPCDSYWQRDNTDALCPADDRALVIDLGRLSGKRAIDEKVREQVVPIITAKLLGMLPSTRSNALIEATFYARPFGFSFAPAKGGTSSIILTRVKAGGDAAKAGLAAGMRLVNLNEKYVGNTHANVVRHLLKNVNPYSLVMRFELPVAITMEPGLYHVRHRSMATAAVIVGHIESFLGHTHVYEDPRMAETNVLLASLLKCNTNVQPVGTLSSAMAVLQYLSGYLSKNPIELCNFVTCIIAARRRCKRYKSTAADAGSHDRNAKFLAQKVLSRQYMCCCNSDMLLL